MPSQEKKWEREGEKANCQIRPRGVVVKGGGRRTGGQTHDGEIDREKKPTVAARRLVSLSVSLSQMSTIDASLREKGGQGMTAMLLLLLVG